MAHIWKFAELRARDLTEAEGIPNLSLGGCYACVIDENPVWAERAHVTGEIGLDYTAIKGAVRLDMYKFDEQTDTSQTNIAEINHLVTT